MRSFPLLTRAALLLVGTSLGLGAPRPVEAQRLRERISQLFIFGSGEDPLFLAGSATNGNPNDVRNHGKHYIPSAVAENGSVIGFLTGSLAGRVSSVPISSTASGVTFRFEGGVPIATSTSAGPIFAERAQTLGRGRVFAGLNRSAFSFTSLRGTPLDDLHLTFTHDNVNYDGCSAEVGNDCSRMGVPLLENETMNVDLDLGIDVAVTSMYLTYGLSNRVDIGVVLPVLQTSFTGSSTATIVPFGPPPAAHFFAGTPANPVLTATRSVSGSVTGLGDIAARVKVNLKQGASGGAALLLDGRFPTGDEEDLLGAGRFTGRALLIMSSTFGAFSPHANLGAMYTPDSTRNSAVLATAGFDHLLGKGITLAVDVVSEFQLGASKLRLPQPVHITFPYARTINPAALRDIRDDILNGSIGFKFSASNRTTMVTNALVPLNSGGLRSRVAYTVGVEYSY